MELAWRPIFFLGLLCLLNPHVAWADNNADAIKKAQATARMIDARLDRAQGQAKVKALGAADRYTLMRRLSLDLNGIIPRREDVKKYASRRSLTPYIEELLKDPRFGLRLSNVLTRAFVGRRRDPNAVFFRGWLQKQVQADRPYDKIVQEMILARPQGRSDETRGSAYFNRRWGPKPEDLASQSARVFMGVQIQCAQCHDHPFTDWKQRQFHGYAAYFTEGAYRYKLKDAQFSQVFEARPLFKQEKQSAPSRRQEVAQLITANDNPYFAKAIVNRLWFAFFGRGLIEPLEDLESNPGRFPQLLDVLAADFMASNYQLKHLVRAMVHTRAYQRRSKDEFSLSQKTPLTKKEREARDRSINNAELLFARATLRPLSPEQIVDSLLRATGREALLQKGSAKTQRLARIRFDYLKEKLQGQFEQLYDDSEGQADLYRGTIPQSLILLNGSFLNEAIDADDGTFMEQVARASGSRKVVLKKLFYQVLSRPPSKEEMKSLAPLLKDKGSRVTISVDLMWALLNSAEWLFNH